MKIQKYKAKRKYDGVEIVGYITEVRAYISDGVYSDGTEYLMSVTEKSMPEAGKYGTWFVDPQTIEPIID